jgi:hypothetical protein
MFRHSRGVVFLLLLLYLIEFLLTVITPSSTFPGFAHDTMIASPQIKLLLLFYSFAFLTLPVSRW